MLDSATSERTRERSATYTLAVDALLCALLILSCFITIPLGPVPFTLQTAVMVVIVLLRRPRDVALITGTYLIMGTVGLPVFSGMSAGIVRASTGFLVGFLVGGVAASALRQVLAKALMRAAEKVPTAASGAASGAASAAALGKTGCTSRAASVAADVAADIAAAVAFLVIDFGLGWAWYVFFAGVSWSGAFAIMVAPFLLTDALKAVAAIVVARELRKRIPRVAD